MIQRAWRNSRGKAFSKRLMPKACELVYDRKERQRDSVLRNYKGDYIQMKQHKMWKSIHLKYNDERVFFAGATHSYTHTHTNTDGHTDALLRAAQFICSQTRCLASTSRARPSRASWW